MQQIYGGGRLDEALSKIDAFARLLSYLQDIGSPEDRGMNRDAEGYILETIISEVHCARESSGGGAAPANDWRCRRCPVEPVCPVRDRDGHRC